MMKYISTLTIQSSEQNNIKLIDDFPLNQSDTAKQLSKKVVAKKNKSQKESWNKKKSAQLYLQALTDLTKS